MFLSGFGFLFTLAGSFVLEPKLCSFFSSSFFFFSLVDIFFAWHPWLCSHRQPLDREALQILSHPHFFFAVQPIQRMSMTGILRETPAPFMSML
ncbi:uncharacterized protein LY79DRAFT_319067 [Colletotrichum navitas]|uniref:Uncharacterized protein n=1 Tax=Colletotrichum navitas TaxID=681940 RepID=A0AAD8PTS9_9PEZI|nr:uncharacterized protein LY79DRAFT_319067 [Colletotrichum navitas]KAK1580077.1 hypothetical protein LY79DRAFT_319067 [Colletotrichum navitas]